MRVVVLGATGNVGTSLVDALVLDRDVDEVVAVARRRPPVDGAAVHYVALDIAADDLVPVFRGADAVVHLAWFFQPTHQPDVTWLNNVVGTARVLDAVTRARVPAFVYASSIAAYSPAPRVEVDESWPTHSSPASSYGREKAYVERLLDAFEEEHERTRVVRMRPAFTFKRAAASEQRRIFAGPFVPNFVARRVPVLPYPRDFRFQVLHTLDAAEAYRLAVHSDARGAFNLATQPVVDGPLVAAVIGARLVEVPPGMIRGALALAWHARLAPAQPQLFDLLQSLPLMDCTRARRELGWASRHNARNTLNDFLRGVAEGAGTFTPPLEPDSTAARFHELGTGVGSRAGP